MRPRHPEPSGDGTSPHPKWQVGEQEFEALMRMLDNLVRPCRPWSFFQAQTWWWESSILIINLQKLGVGDGI